MEREKKKSRCHEGTGSGVGPQGKGENRGAERIRGEQVEQEKGKGRYERRIFRENLPHTLANQSVGRAQKKNNQKRCGIENRKTGWKKKRKTVTHGGHFDCGAR